LIVLIIPYRNYGREGKGMVQWKRGKGYGAVEERERVWCSGREGKGMVQWKRGKGYGAVEVHSECTRGTVLVVLY
jgi:hypothetical protein